MAALRAREEAAQENLGTVWVTLSAEIAKNYIQLRGFQRRRDIVQKRIDHQEEAVKLTRELAARRGSLKKLISIGLRPKRATLRPSCLSLKWAARGPASPFTAAGLSARRDGSVSQSSRPFTATPGKQPIGLPSELLRRRPDIRKAERELAAATERVAVPLRPYFPAFPSGV